MLQSFIIFHVRECPEPSSSKPADNRKDALFASPEQVIASLGFRTYLPRDEAAAKAKASLYDAIILCVGQEQLGAREMR